MEYCFLNWNIKINKYLTKIKVQLNTEKIQIITNI